MAADDSAIMLTGTGYSSGVHKHHHHEQEQQQLQQSIEMTQLDVGGGVSGRINAGDSYKKPKKNQQSVSQYKSSNIAIGHSDYIDENDNNEGDNDKDNEDDDDDVDNDRIESKNTGKHHRESQLVLDGSIVVDHYYSSNNSHVHQSSHLQQQRGSRRRCNAAVVSDSLGMHSTNSVLAAPIGTNISNYNTVVGIGGSAGSGTIGYYAADVYASMGTRQQQAKRYLQQPQRQYSASNVAAATADLAMKRSWRRQPNQKCRASSGAAVVDHVTATSVICGDVNSVESSASMSRLPAMVSTYGIDGDGLAADDPVSMDSGYRNIVATQTAKAQLEKQYHHHHRARQKNDILVRSSSDFPGRGPPPMVTSSDQQQQHLANTDGGGNNNGNNVKNVVQFHNIGREIDV